MRWNSAQPTAVAWEALRFARAEDIIWESRSPLIASLTALEVDRFRGELVGRV
ncbi:MAG: hypothetical protein WDN28_24550 [Chthoniobacter sp.]